MLYNSKKYNRLKKVDQGKAFGKTFNYTYGREKAKKMAEGRNMAKSRALDKMKKDNEQF